MAAPERSTGIQVRARYPLVTDDAERLDFIIDSTDGFAIGLAAHGD
jgi:hypothetical protein